MQLDIFEPLVCKVTKYHLSIMHKLPQDIQYDIIMQDINMRHLF